MGSHGEFNILGCVEVAGPGGQLELPGSRRRALIAALSLQPSVVVPTWRLVEALWGERPPRTAIRSLHSHVARLRLALDASGLGGVLQTREPGYVLSVRPEAVDACRFEQEAQAARKSLAAGLADGAVEALDRALSLWRGEALADAEPTGWTAAEAARLEDMRLAALADRCEAMLFLGRYGDALLEAERLLNLDPTRERLVGLRMIALYGSGRPTDALDAYQWLRARLADELGVDPSPELADVHTCMLRGAATTDLRAPGSVVGPRSAIKAASATTPRPAQLPARAGYFTGRAAELSVLDSVVEADAGGERPVVLICGQGGVGKTSLAVQWAHRVVERFPDGQLFVDVRGNDPATALTAEDVVAVLLRCLGVPDDRVPNRLGERIGLYRSLLAGKRMLIVLDNVGATGQVVPVIPNAAASLLLVTSRNNLAALVTHVEARTVVLDVLSQDEAIDLLAKMLGAQRVGREPEAAVRVAGLCCQLPLALRIAAAKLVMQPNQSIGGFADEVSGGDRLTHLGVEDGGRSVEAVFTSAYQALSAPAMRLFRLLGLHPGPHISAPLAAALCGLPIEQQRHALAELVAVHLITEPQPGRYRLHDLVRLFAQRRALADEATSARIEATERLVDWYLATADAANRVLDRSHDRIAPMLRHPAPEVPFRTTREAALAFLESERENLVVIVRYAAGHDQPAAACQLTYLLTSFFNVRGNWSERVEMCLHAVRAAGRLGDPAVEAEMHRALGAAYRVTHQLGEAFDSHHRALVLLRTLGDERGLAYVYNNIGGVDVELRHFEEAIEAYQMSLHLHTSCDNRAGVATAQRNLGYVYVRMDRADLSFPHLGEALAISRAIGYQRLEAGALDSLGEAHFQSKQHDQALDCFRSALAVSRDIGDRRYEMGALNNIGLTHLARGEAADAVDFLSQSLAVSRLIGHRHAEARTLNHLGEAHMHLKDFEAAGRHLNESAGLRQTLPDAYEEARLHRNLADLAHLTGRPATATHHWELASSLYRKANATHEADQMLLDRPEPAVQQPAHDDVIVSIASPSPITPAEGSKMVT